MKDQSARIAELLILLKQVDDRNQSYRQVDSQEKMGNYERG